MRALLGFACNADAIGTPVDSLFSPPPFDCHGDGSITWQPSRVNTEGESLDIQVSVNTLQVRDTTMHSLMAKDVRPHHTHVRPANLLTSAKHPLFRKSDDHGDANDVIVHAARTQCARCTHAPTVHTARTHCAHCTHALCTLHARIVHTAHTHCARCTHALCTPHARTVHTARTVHAARTHCARCTHALYTLQALIVVRIVHTARTHCEHLHCAHARIPHTSHTHCEHAHCAHRTHALCTLYCLLAGPLYLLIFVGHTWEHSLWGIRSGLLHGGLLDLKTNPTPVGEHGDRGL